MKKRTRTRFLNQLTSKCSRCLTTDSFSSTDYPSLVYHRNSYLSVSSCTFDCDPYLPDSSCTTDNLDTSTQRHVGLYPYHDSSHFSCYYYELSTDCSCTTLFEEINSLFKLEKYSAKESYLLSQTTHHSFLCSLDCSMSLPRQTQIDTSHIIDLDS